MSGQRERGYLGLDIRPFQVFRLVWRFIPKPVKTGSSSTIWWERICGSSVHGSRFYFSKELDSDTDSLGVLGDIGETDNSE
jgi:hypothetical protein